PRRAPPPGFRRPARLPPPLQGGLPRHNGRPDASVAVLSARVKLEGAMQFLAISGSLRHASSNTQLLRAVALLAPPGLRITQFDGLGALPHFNPDLDTDPPSPAVRVLRESIAAADGLLISSPEYAHGVPGVLKNVLDWLV